jgi:Raf kinase inhibitor-like YbhB/YbcL family protein
MGTLSFALTELDPDVPKSFSPIGFPHWVVYNIPAAATSITPKSVTLYTSGKMGIGQYSYPGYHGPCPPLHGPAHHYHFTLYALNVGHLAGKALNYSALQKAIKGHVLGKATLIGTFARP